MIDPRASAFWVRLKANRLAYTLTILATLAIGILIGTIVSRGVKGQESKKGSDATPLSVPTPKELSNQFSQISKQLEPSVVNINTESTIKTQRRRRGPAGPEGEDQNPFDDFFDRFFGGPGGGNSGSIRERSLGSGVLVDPKGYIVTNRHVVEKADRIRVKLQDDPPGVLHDAKVIGTDQETDLAVIRIESSKPFPVAKLGNSDGMQVGDWVLAVGSPFGLQETVTAGIVSAKGRNIVPNRQFQSFLQTDAAINPGNSGGPLVNMTGEVIGINTAIISETRQSAGLGFALPSNTAIKVYNQLVQSGKVTRGGIGIQYSANPTQDASLCRALGLKAECGVVVQYVVPGGPAAKAGIRAGDVITEIDGAKISTGSALLDVVANSPIGRTIRVKVNRDGKEQTIPIVIGDRQEVIGERTSNNSPDSNDQSEGSQSKLGIRVQGITSDMVRQLRLNSSDGAYVSSVDQDSAAEDAGIMRGMIITRVIAGNERFEIRNVDDFKRAERV